MLGPAADGGYYLIAMGKTVFIQATPRLFDGIRWGTDGVLSQTLAVADKLSLSYFLLDSYSELNVMLYGFREQFNLKALS